MNDYVTSRFFMSIVKYVVVRYKLKFGSLLSLEGGGDWGL